MLTGGGKHNVSDPIFQRRHAGLELLVSVLAFKSFVFKLHGVLESRYKSDALISSIGTDVVDE